MASQKSQLNRKHNFNNHQSVLCGRHANLTITKKQQKKKQNKNSNNHNNNENRLEEQEENVFAKKCLRKKKM